MSKNKIKFIVLSIIILVIVSIILMSLFNSKSNKNSCGDNAFLNMIKKPIQ